MTGPGPATTMTGAAAAAAARGQHVKQHRVQIRSTITASSVTAAQPSRTQPAVVGCLPQKNVAVHAASVADGPGAGARDESLCDAQKVPELLPPAAVAQPTSQTHLSIDTGRRHQARGQDQNEFVTVSCCESFPIDEHAEASRRTCSRHSSCRGSRTRAVLSSWQRSRLSRRLRVH